MCNHTTHTTHTHTHTNFSTHITQQTNKHTHTHTHTHTHHVGPAGRMQRYGRPECVASESSPSPVLRAIAV